MLMKIENTDIDVKKYNNLLRHRRDHFNHRRHQLVYI
jgi:hypothetical protein